MNSSANFSHIYVESEIRSDPRTEGILARFPDSHVILVQRGSDVFNRPRQSFSAQKKSRSLILARKHGTLFYHGAPVCHSFHASRFFYTTTAVGCLFDCEYCWLKGIYASASLMIFINQEDYFRELEELLKDGSLFLSLSYETDLFAIEELTGHIHAWASFAREHPDLVLEIRTKSSRTDLFRCFENCPNVIVAYTLSPQSVITAFEHHTPSLSKRIQAVRKALAEGCTVRLCLDPLIKVNGWRKDYEALTDTLHQEIDLSRIKDVSIGSYRQSEPYQRRMRKRFPYSAVIQYPYETEDGYCVYSDHREIDQWMRGLLERYMEKEKIFSLEDCE